MKKIMKQVRFILTGDFIKTAKVRQLFPYLIFICFLALLYIANTYNAMIISRKANDIEEELVKIIESLKDEERRYIKQTTQDSLSRILEPTGIKQATGNIYKINDSISTQNVIELLKIMDNKSTK